MDITENYKEKLLENLPKVGASFLIIIIFYIVAIIYKRNILSYIDKNKKNSASKKLLYDFLAKIVYYVFIIIGIFLALANLGFNINTLLVVFGSAGLALALAIQSTFTQVVSGLIIIIFEYFNHGDLIEINGTMGYVENFNLLYTILYDTRGVKIIVPNNLIINGNFVNYYDKEQIYSSFSVKVSNNNDFDYDVLLNNIKDELRNKCPYVIDKDDVFAVISNASASGTEISVRFLIERDNYYKALYSGQYIVRKLFSDSNILLLDNSYLSQ